MKYHSQTDSVEDQELPFVRWGKKEQITDRKTDGKSAEKAPDPDMCRHRRIFPENPVPAAAPSLQAVIPV